VYHDTLFPQFPGLACNKRVPGPHLAKDADSKDGGSIAFGWMLIEMGILADSPWAAEL